MSETPSSGIEPLDERVGGLETGGLYLLASPPDPGRTAAVVQFLHAGLRAGEPVALVGRMRPDRVLRAAERFGRDLDEAWRDGRLHLVGFRGGYETRIRRAGSVEEVYDELASLLDPWPGRLVFDPGTVLWERRGDAAAATAFVDFVDRTSATTLATTTQGLTGDLPLSTELVAQAALGLFRLETAGRGLLRLSIDSLDGARPDRSEVTLELRDGAGLVAPEGPPGRRSADREGASDELLYLDLDGGLPEEILSWIRRNYAVTRAEEPLDLVSRLQAGTPFGLVLVSAGRGGLTEARRACRVCRRLRPGLPVMVVSGAPFRASDRADLLRDGADECMTGGLNVEELASRLELAASRTGSRPEPAETDDAPGEPSTNGRGAGPLDEGDFRAELQERLEASEPGVFTVIRFHADDAEGIAERLSPLLRAAEGDFAGRLGGASAVWLAGTAPSEADGFVRRVRDAVRQAAGGGTVETEVLGSARDADTLRDLAG